MKCMFERQFISRAEQEEAEQSRAGQSRAEQSLSFSRRFSWLDILKGIGIILVSIGHIYSSRCGPSTWLYFFPYAVILRSCRMFIQRKAYTYGC